MSATFSSIQSRALEVLQSAEREPTCEAVAHAVVDALMQEGVDPYDGAVLDQVKTLLAEVGREARTQWDDQKAIPC